MNLLSPVPTSTGLFLYQVPLNFEMDLTQSLLTLAYWFLVCAVVGHGLFRLMNPMYKGTKLQLLDSLKQLCKISLKRGGKACTQS
jgi:hypothetical protein